VAQCKTVENGEVVTPFIGPERVGETVTGEVDFKTYGFKVIKGGRGVRAALPWWGNEGGGVAVWFNFF
jgi:hypothetical protein